MTSLKESTVVMRRAINEGIIDPTPSAIAKKIFGNASLFKPLMEQIRHQRSWYALNPKWLGKQNSWVSPTTRRYQQSENPPTSPITNTINAPWLVELARWTVPDGYVGIIKSFEQWLSLPGIQTPTIYSSLTNWGNPFVMLPNRVDWYFRLSPTNRDNWMDVTGLSAIPEYLPGMPYTDLPHTSDLWFPATSPSSANLHLPVPGGFTLRVFLITPAIQYLSAAAKLQGTVQNELSSEAQHVVRVTW
jgi:hypothetical protein